LTDIPLSSVTITIRGIVKIALTAQARIQAFCKFAMQGLLGADVKVGMLFKICSGSKPDEISFQYTNAGATTPAVYFWSTAKAAANAIGFDILCSEETIQATSSQIFKDFSALFFSETNFDYAQVEFSSGWSDKLSAAELCGLFSTNRISDADGKLAGLICVDNSGQQFRNITLYTTSGGTLVVAKMKIG